MSVELEEGRFTKDNVLANIPAFPPIVLRVLDMVSSDRPDPFPLVQEISNDATLSAQVLRLANSPLFGLEAQVDTVHRAVVTLGLLRVQSLVTTLATANYLKTALPSSGLEKCWRHTLACAILARELARVAGFLPDRVYSLGLLHDIGRLGLLVAYAGEYSGLLHAADRDAVSLLDLEKKRFGMDHCEAGRSLAERSKWPSDFCRIAGRHHDSPAGAPLDSLTIVHLACLLADLLGYSVVTPLHELSFEQIRRMLPPAAREQLAEDPEVLRDLIEGTIGEHRSLVDEPDQSVAMNLRSFPPPSPDSGIEPEAIPLLAILEAAPSAWDSNVFLLAAMVLLTLLAGVFCLWNGWF